MFTTWGPNNEPKNTLSTTYISLEKLLPKDAFSPCYDMEKLEEGRRLLQAWKEVQAKRTSKTPQARAAREQQRAEA